MIFQLHFLHYSAPISAESLHQSSFSQGHSQTWALFSGLPPALTLTEEFLSQQHDNMVKQMYRVKKELKELTLKNYDLAIPSTKRVAEILYDDSFYENYMDLYIMYSLHL